MTDPQMVIPPDLGDVELRAGRSPDTTERWRPTMTDRDALREALAPFQRIADDEASRLPGDAGHFVGPGGLTNADWRKLAAALDQPAEPWWHSVIEESDTPIRTVTTPDGRVYRPEPGLDVERLARMRDLIEAWLDAERLLDTMTVYDGTAHQDAWDAVHFSREQVAAEYARLGAEKLEADQ